ncbi:MAG: hypothetical protein GY716_21890 [bacterium]|nr:hypothetical protein [bacterium]
MSAASIPRIYHPFTFLLAAAAIYVCSIVVAGMLPDLPQAELVAIGMTCDLVLLVPALFYLILVRGRGWSPIGLVPVFILSIVAAAQVLPADRQAALSAFEIAAIPVEFGVLGFIGWRAQRAIRTVRGRLRGEHADAFDAIRDAALDVTGNATAASLMAQELATLYYAFFSWRTPLPESGFSSYRKNSWGVFVAAISMAVVIETFAVHLLIHLLWSSVAAWIFTGLSVYSMIWVVGDFQALRLRRHVFAGGECRLRLGTRWEVDIPLDVVESVRALGADEADTKTDKPLNLVLIGAPDVELTLSRPLTARGLMGFRRSTTRINLQVDEPERFLAQFPAA